MIDDVDVNGCKYWKGYCRIASLCDYSGHLCEVTPNCYYKQLKRKEQELNQYRPIIDRLLKQLETYDKLKSLDVFTYTKQVFEQLDQLKTECEEWKNKYYSSTTETKADLIKQIKQLKAENEELKTCYKNNLEVLRHEEKVNNNLTDRVMKAEQALQEIKGIVFELMKADKSYKFDKYSSKILQKCEVIDE